jgi:RNA polymerase sigma-70 factor (ECF subfamily)
MFRGDPFKDPERLIRRVYSYVAYRIGDGAEAEDVTSEVVERALRYRDSYDAEKGNAAAWMIGIARRCIAESFSTIRPSGAEVVDVADGRDLEAEATQRVFVAGTVAALSESDRELIALRYGADLTAKQIAAHLGLKTNAVEVALHRALGRLRVLLEADDSKSEAPEASPAFPAVGG